MAGRGLVEADDSSRISFFRDTHGEFSRGEVLQGKTRGVEQSHLIAVAATRALAINYLSDRRRVGLIALKPSASPC